MTSPETELGFVTKGSLKRVPFSSLLRDIAGAGVTGSLYLMSGDTKKVVFFVDGRPTLVRSNLAAEFLGQILTDHGLITQEQCDNTLEAIRRTGKKQGEMLVEMGILSENNLRYGLEEQLRRKLFEIFDWDEGRFQFKPGAEPGVTGNPPAGTTEALILAAIQERFTDERAREALRAWADRYPTPNPKWGGDPASLDLLPEELYFLRCIDGSRTTDELLTRKPDLEVPRLSTLLLGLISAGVVEPLDTKSPRRLAPLRPNLTPPAIPDEQLAPNFEVLSTIGEYEDTPLPSRLPTDLGASSSKNPRVPILPTEDEEMFRGLDGDESIVTDARQPRLKPRPGAAPVPVPPIEPEPAPAIAAAPPEPEPVTAAPEAFDRETDFSDLHAAPEPQPEPVTEAPTAAPGPDGGKHKLGPAPGLASLLRKDAKPVEEAPVEQAALSHTSAAIALLDDPELPDDLPDDLPDPDDLLGDEPIEDIEELEELDDEMIEADDDDDGDDALAAAAEDSFTAGATDLEAAASPDLAASETDDALADLAGLAGADLGDLAGERGDLATEPPPSLAPISLPPEALGDDLPDEPGNLGDLGDLGDLGALGDLAGESGVLAAGGLEPGPADELLAGDPDDLLGAIDDDLLLAGDDEPLPELDDLDGLDLADLGADLGDLDGDADLGGDLGADLGDASLSADLGDPDLSGDLSLAAADLGDPDLSGDLSLAAADLGDPNLSGDLSLEIAAADLGDPNLSGDLAADFAAAGLDDPDLSGDLSLEIAAADLDVEDLDPLDDPDLGDLGDLDENAGYADEPMIASGETTYVGPADEPTSAEGSAERYAALRYSEAEAAMRDGDYETASILFEDAYNTGFDTADLHAHLAFARYRAANGDPEFAQNSLALLEYAENINPGLAILHAYRGVILVGLGEAEQARECFERALYLDPYCELALEYREA